MILGVTITNTKFWYIQTIGSNETVRWNDNEYNLNESLNLQGDFDSIAPELVSLNIMFLIMKI